MLSNSKIEAYRRMSPGERWREVEELMSLAWRTLQALPDDELQRRVQVIRNEHDLSDAIILERLRTLS